MGSEMSSKNNSASQIMELELSTMGPFEHKESTSADGAEESLNAGMTWAWGITMKPSRSTLFSEDFFCPFVKSKVESSIDSQLDKAQIDVEVEVKTMSGNSTSTLDPSEERQEGEVGESIFNEPEVLLEEAEVKDEFIQDEVGEATATSLIIETTTANAEMIDAAGKETEDKDECMQDENGEGKQETAAAAASLITKTAEDGEAIEEAADQEAEDKDEFMQDENGERERGMGAGVVSPIIEPIANVEMIDEAADKEAKLSTVDLLLSIRIEKTPPILGADIGTNTSQPTFQDVDVGTSQVLMMESETAMSQPFTSDGGVQTSQSLLDELLLSLTKNLVADGKQMTLNPSKNQFMRGSVSTSPSPLFSRTPATDDHSYAAPAKRPRLGDVNGNSAKRSIYSAAVTFDFDEPEKESMNLDRDGCKISYDRPESDDFEDKENQSRDEAYQSPALAVLPFTNIYGPARRQGLSKKARKPLHPKILRPQQNQNQEN